MQWDADIGLSFIRCVSDKQPDHPMKKINIIETYVNNE